MLKVGGDPVRLRWSAEDRIDVPVSDVVPDTDLLFEGIDLLNSPLFDNWLFLERRRQSAAAPALLREKALAELAAGHGEHAVAPAGRLVEAEPLEESGQTLLVRALAVGGDRTAAEQAARQCELLFGKQVGASPSPAVRAPLEAGRGHLAELAASGPSAVRAQLTAGRAALAAGATDADIDCLRRSVLEARTVTHSCSGPHRSVWFHLH